MTEKPTPANIASVIEQIERMQPDLGWLVRTCDDNEEIERLGGEYLAHIHSPATDPLTHSYAESYWGYGDTPLAALQMAFDLSMVDGGAA